MEQIVKQVVNDLREDFASYPFKYTSSEAEAQYRVFALLESKHIKENITINRSGPGGPVPPFENEVSPRLRIEWGFDRRQINDIVIFKEGVVDPSSYDDVEAVIEIKSTWGEYPHLDNDGFLKDLRFINKYPKIGFLLAFFGNKFNELSKHYQDYYNERFEALKNSQEYSFPSGHVYLIFRDKLIQ